MSDLIKDRYETATSKQRLERAWADCEIACEKAEVHFQQTFKTAKIIKLELEANRKRPMKTKSEKAVRERM